MRYNEIKNDKLLPNEAIVSVQMITFNHEDYISEAIFSVVNQKTNSPFELVIGEDCSTDNTRNIIIEFQKKYPDIIRLILNETNVGMSKNGFNTLKLCKGNT